MLRDVRRCATGDGTESTRLKLARDALKAFRGQPSLTARKLTVDEPRSLRIDDGALVLPMTLYTSLGRIHAALAFGVRHRAETIMVAAAVPGSRLTATDLAPLIAATSDHVHAGLLPINTTPPTVSGATQLGQTLTAAPGAWSNRPVSLAYQWQRCDTGGAACIAIAGATGQTYNVGVADPGATLRVSVTASNSVGQAMATSRPTPAVSFLVHRANHRPRYRSGAGAGDQHGTGENQGPDRRRECQRADQARAAVSDIALVTTTELVT